MVEWSWRIEDATTILCGSWSEEERWEPVFARLIGQKVEDIFLHGRLPELGVDFSGGTRLLTFMTAEDQPAWTLFRNHSDRDPDSLFVSNGAVVNEKQGDAQP